jgi:hypothetical protein
VTPVTGCSGPNKAQMGDPVIRVLYSETGIAHGLFTTLCGGADEIY